MRKSKAHTNGEAVKLNGHDRAHPPLNPGSPLPSSSPPFITLTSKRGAVVHVRPSAIAAIWEDKGSLDGPFFVQAAGRTFHPNAESFTDVQRALCILHSA